MEKSVILIIVGIGGLAVLASYAVINGQIEEEAYRKQAEEEVYKKQASKSEITLDSENLQDLQTQRIGEESYEEVFTKLNERFEKKADEYYAELSIEFEGAETVLDTTVYEYRISWVDNVAIFGEWNDKQCENIFFVAKNLSYCERDKTFEKSEFLDEGVLEITASQKRVEKVRLFLNYREPQEQFPSQVAGMHHEIVRTVAPHLINDSKYISWASGMMEKKFQSTKQFGSIKASLDSDWDGFFEFIMKIG